MLGARTAECPNCGAPIAWQLASSQAAVCKYCQFSVLRSDRELTAIGRVADLVPTAAPLALGDEGSAAGKRFRVLGRIQLDHGRGPWDEWYLGFADGGWGWLARAEGRWYVTYERPGYATWEEAAPGTALTLAGVDWVVTERGGSAVVSAEGELPYPLDPHGSGRYADLEGPQGAFATLDFGPPLRFFAGRELRAEEVVLTRAAVGPRPLEKVAVQKLSCPTCGAPVAIHAPTAERVGCGHCGALLDHAQGSLRLLQQFDPPLVKPLIPLGSRGTLFGAERTVVGFMQRAVTVDGDRYTFREYLLWSEGGYAWLIEENHHWLYVAPVATSAVKVASGSAFYRDHTYRAFARGAPEVELVIGEFYWKVMAGDRCETFDYVAPPRLLSVEKTENELSWSEGEYVQPAALVRAFGLKGLPAPSGVAPAQPNPHRAGVMARAFGLLAFLWLLLAFAYEVGHPQKYTYEGLVLQGPPGSGMPSADQVLLSEPFTLSRGPTTIAVEAYAPILSGSVYVEASLIPEDPPGEPRVLPLVIEHYQGDDGGESWSEGSTSATEYFGSVPAGRYSFRFVGSWEPDLTLQTNPPVKLTATVGERSPACCFGTLFLLVLPWLLTWLRALAFEARRKENENLP
jgi:ribosomal protein S27AE/DNA-directed RNA polymerase subunit RPC12/RpoP